ncbi:MAG: hypothetical protein F6J90_26500 [Moorea sp. SIOASIH]|uniref:hypothetical protein n=1 Tax=Moorena sp. SIOASIH TaxID=2607817 RepID=UPI0013BA1D0A|nr:hypothetical protein [Moorena sp. SIOASIH]NEO39688.1 hypothetical protein [Moorena sp. SIOASIH]NEO90305.1 hypothetical protein [Moorena sp. SIO3G5]
MLTTPSHKLPVVTVSKINHKSRVVHPLARFVTENTVALFFNIQPEEIYRIDCWQHVVYVHAKGVSQFVSYADFPPILGVDPPKTGDYDRWLKRRDKRHKSKQSLGFWSRFYAQQFKQASSKLNLYQWGKLVGLVKRVLFEAELQQLRQIYVNEKSWWDDF